MKGIRERITSGMAISTSLVIIAIVAVALLAIAAFREPKSARGYSELSLTKGGCTVMGTPMNVTSCGEEERGLYSVDFSEPVSASTPMVTPSTCCLREVGAAVDDENDRQVLIAVGRVKPREFPIVVQVLVP